MSEAPTLRLPPLTDGLILRRYKRFLADVALADGRVVTAHCANTGAMATCWEPGARVQLSHSDDPRRKLPWTLERVDMGGGWIGVNTMRPNQVVHDAVLQGLIRGLDGYRSVRREIPFAPDGMRRGRLDLALSDGSRPDALVEIKNVTLLDGDCLRFPDAVSERGRKHLDLLQFAVTAGMRGVILFAANRPEGMRVGPAWGIDPDYGRRLVEVAASGVEVMAVRIHHGPQSMETADLVPVDLSRP